MSSKRFFISIAGLVGVLLLGMWLVSTPQASTADVFPLYSPIEPIGDPEIHLVKTVDNENPVPGDLIEYTLTYWSAIPGDEAYNARLYEFLPAGVSFVSSDPEADLRQNRMLRFDLGTLGPDIDDAEVSIVVEVLPGFDELYNHALIGADGVVPVHASLRTLVTQPPASLRLVKTGYAYAIIGGELVYTLMCQNVSETGTASNVKLIDVLPTGLPLVGASPPPDEVMLPVLTWSAGDLGPGERFEIVITTTAPSSPGIITNTALADAQQRLVTQTMFATQVVTEGAILIVDKTGSAPAVQPGDPLFYSLYYENIGNQVASDVLMTDTFPSGIQIDGQSAPGSLIFIHDGMGVWNLGTLNPGDSGRIVISTTVENPGNRTLLNIVDIAGQPAGYPVFPGHDELETDVNPHWIYLPYVAKENY